jgi:hypothetical protein
MIAGREITALLGDLFPFNGGLEPAISSILKLLIGVPMSAPGVLCRIHISFESVATSWVQALRMTRLMPSSGPRS